MLKWLSEWLARRLSWIATKTTCAPNEDDVRKILSEMPRYHIQQVLGLLDTANPAVLALAKNRIVFWNGISDLRLIQPLTSEERERLIRTKWQLASARYSVPLEHETLYSGHIRDDIAFWRRRAAFEIATHIGWHLPNGFDPDRDSVVCLKGNYMQESVCRAPQNPNYAMVYVELVWKPFIRSRHVEKVTNDA